MKKVDWFIYRRFIKRPFDIILSLIALIILSPMILIIALLVRFKLGSPVIFRQKRPGLNEHIFIMYKFRSMTDERDENGELLPDSVRLTRFGRFIRSTSLDELPEFFNILKGDMSIVGPRPLSVKYLPYYFEEERKRHSVRPGLTGLAQVNGRNVIHWEERFSYDLHYVNDITFSQDLKIILLTIMKTIKRNDIGENGVDATIDFHLYRQKIMDERNRGNNLKLQNTSNESTQSSVWTFRVIKTNEVEDWNKITKSFKKHDVYYLNEYVRAFERNGDGEPLLFFYQDQHIKAMDVVMKRDISKDPRFTDNLLPNTYYDLITPYGYSGFLVEGNVSNESLHVLDEQYTSTCIELGIVSEFVRFHPVLSNETELHSIYEVQKLGKTITIDLNSQEVIWTNLSKSGRYSIKKARRDGVEIFWGRDTELVEEFIQLYEATMETNNADNYYYFKRDFYESVLRDLKYNSMIFYAVYENRKIAMSIILFANDWMHYHLAALDREYSHLQPMSLLIYEAACWGSENGFKTFHLGGGLGSKEDSLYNFKKSFNKNSATEFKIGKKVISEERYMQLLQIREKHSHKEVNRSYFPEYRG